MPTLKKAHSCGSLSVEEISICGSDHDFMDGSSATGEGGRSNIEECQFTGKETRLVNRSKMIVYLVLAIAAASVSTVVYKVLVKDEENTMTTEFAAYSREILKQAQANSENMFEELWDMGKGATSHALAANMTFPYVTIPHFDIRGHDKRSRVEFIGYAPYVTPETRSKWEEYSVENQGWIAQDFKYRGWPEPPPRIPTKIHRYNSTNTTMTEYEDEDWDYEIPLWQVAPLDVISKNASIINLDLATQPVFGHLLRDIRVKKVEQYSRVIDLKFLLGDEITDDHPRGTIYQPVFEDFREDADVVGFIVGILTWDNMFENALFDSSAPLIVEIEGTCNVRITYRVTGSEIVFLGYGDGWRDPKFDKYKQSADLLTPKGARPGYEPVKHTHRPSDASHGQSHCTYVMNTYPTQEFEDQFTSKDPVHFTLVIASVFVFTTFVFYFFDLLVQRRQQKLVSTAKRTDAIVASMFPKDVQKRIMEEAGGNKQEARSKDNMMSAYFDKQDGNENNNSIVGEPIADLFPSVTIMFADIVGFTAWSSMREPSHVFQLLEALYSSFDAIAKKRRVFKVETIGDCYVAVVGLPSPNKNHASVMARFASDCLQKMQEQLSQLSVHLGADTIDLGMRIGLHSGPVTAGVLRGERARFQLFGDSVNTAARIETTGQKNRIHLSEQTANCLVELGKEHWIQEREDEVVAKGKGKLRTWWLKSTLRASDTASVINTDMSNHVESNEQGEDEMSAIERLSEKDMLLVDWNVERLSKILRQIMVRRRASGEIVETASSSAELQALELQCVSDKFGVLDEVKDTIKLPKVDTTSHNNLSGETGKVELSDDVAAELYEFVSNVAALHNDHPFHSFDHASHVVMSVVKLLSRMVTLEAQPVTEGEASGDESSTPHHQHGAYGITSDPLTVFALVLSALIHDIGHPGVPNPQLVKEKTDLAACYKGKSVAEQYAVDVGFQLLMDDRFVNLRGAIYSNVTEFQRFRALVVNSVMATDIMDKQLGEARKARWNKTFSEQANDKDEDDSLVDRKIACVIDHTIQASDVAHTMQHWHIYRKWNERLFHEMYRAFREGRSDKDPTDNWYEGEIGFFDFYVIPLAKKLKDCGVFGVSSDELLTYAKQNREEWKAKGKEQVALYLERYNDVEEGSAHPKKHTFTSKKAMNDNHVTKEASTGQEVALGEEVHV